MGFNYDRYVSKPKGRGKKKGKRNGKAPPKPTRGTINSVDSGRTRDVPMHERPEWEREALRRLRAIDEQAW